MMGQGRACDDPISRRKAALRICLDRKSRATPAVRQDMRYVLLIILIGLLIFLANQVWLLFTGTAFF